MSRLAILLVVSMIGGSQACSCIFETVAQRYCRSDYAVLARVTEEDRGSDQPQDAGNGLFILPFRDVTYTLDVKKIFRNKDNHVVTGENIVTTPPNSAACGVTLQKDTYYILAGSYRFDRGQFQGLRLFSCGSIIIQQPASESQKEDADNIRSGVFDSQCNQ